MLHQEGLDPHEMCDPLHRHPVFAAAISEDSDLTSPLDWQTESEIELADVKFSD
jgi:hypothetical protein